MKKLQVIVLFYFTPTIQAQEKKVLFGIIRDSLHDISNVHILNLNSKGGTISAADGTFKIFAKVGDTLVISAIQYQEKKYLIKKKVLVFKV